ncbi:MAG TPA: TonB-dependent receptor [Pyrinomonadaceae bacterium]|jgi:outer membrane receptor protein involved in Fe transport
MIYTPSEAVSRSVHTAKSLSTTICLFALLLLCAVPLNAKNNSATPVGQVSGTVTDQTGASVDGADVVLLGAAASEAQRSVTDQDGRFSMQRVLAADYVVCVQKSGFRELRRVLHVNGGETLQLQFQLNVALIVETVTVTPTRGQPQDASQATQAQEVLTDDDMARRQVNILPQALRDVPGVHLQQTTSGQGSPFVRGLTGQQVLHLINGVRFNNSTFRPGANQYTALIDPIAAERVEIVRGPGSTQYGSDSLGGTINVLTRPVKGSDTFTAHGSVNTFFASADLSFGAATTISGSARNWGFLADVSGYRTQDLRTGSGLDSHSVVTRLLGISSKFLGNRLQDTAYGQYNANAKFQYKASEADVISVEYLRGTQLGLRRYDQLDGGIGNLLNSFDPQMLNFFTARYDRVGVGPLDSITAILSFNGQRDDRRSQSINNAQGLRSKITDEFNLTRAYGYQAQATSHVKRTHAITFGAEFYNERITSTRQEFSFNNTTQDFTNVADVRARFPNGANYRTLGLFVQDVATLVPQRLTANVGLRYSIFHYHQSPEDNPLDAAGRPTVPQLAASFDDVTFNAGLAYAINSHFTLTGNVSRGFRAPNVNDFASTGLSGLGFEIAPDEGVRLGGSTGLLDSSRRLVDMHPLEPIRAEQLYSYELGLRFVSSSFSGNLSAFDSEISDLIERRTLLLPSGAVGQLVGGQPIIRQDSTGAVFTSLSNSAVFVRTNATRVRMRGVEGSLAVKLRRDLTANANIFYVRGTDLRTGLPPSLENGIPPATGFAGVKWERASRWIELYSSFAAPQRRFSDNDISQARIGGLRTKEEIAGFFNGGAVARGLVHNGILLPTGETLSQVQVRVLGPGLQPGLLLTKNPGFALLNLRGGFRIGERSSVTVILENLLDKNYRTMGSGIDGAGTNAAVRYSFSF